MKLGIQVFTFLCVVWMLGCRHDDHHSTGQEHADTRILPKEVCSSPMDSIQEAKMIVVPAAQDKLIRERLRTFCSSYLMLDASESWALDNIECKLMVNYLDSYWVVPISSSQIAVQDYLLTYVHDGRIVATTRIPAHWIENDESLYPEDRKFIIPPLFRVEDMNHDGEVELLIKDRRHNGNTVDVAVELIFGVRGKSLKLLGRFEYLCDDWSRESYLVRTWSTHEDSIAVYAGQCPFPKEKQFIGSFKAHWALDTVLFRDPQVKEKKYADVLIQYDNSL